MAYWLWFGDWAKVLFVGAMVLADLGHARSLTVDEMLCATDAVYRP